MSSERLSRRKLLKDLGKGLGIAAGTAVVGYTLYNSYEEDQTTKTNPPKNQPFTDPAAQAIAEKYNIHTVDFFRFPRDINFYKNLNGFKSSEILPDKWPAVIDYKEAIYKATADGNQKLWEMYRNGQLEFETKVPANVVAAIATIESAGLASAGSQAGAIGLVQVTKDKFPNSILNISDPQLRLAAMEDPYNNILAGILYFGGVCLPYAIKNNPPLPDSLMYDRAAIAYNAGQSRAGTEFSQLPDETKWYADHFMRIEMTDQIAAELRQMGMSDGEIVRSLVSLNVNAICFAFEKFVIAAKMANLFDYNYYDLAISAFENMILYDKPKIPDNLNDQQRDQYTDIWSTYYSMFLEYRQKKPEEEAPLPPSIRIWKAIAARPAGTGPSVFQVSPNNLDPNAWYNMSTR